MSIGTRMYRSVGPAPFAAFKMDTGRGGRSDLSIGLIRTGGRAGRCRFRRKRKGRQNVDQFNGALCAATPEPVPA